MYSLTRLVLSGAALSSMWVIAVLVWLTWPLSGLILAWRLIVWIATRRFARLTTLGSACWASERELRSRGMLETKSGLILGRVGVRRPRLCVATVLRVLNPRVRSATACSTFGLGGGGAIVRLPHAVHTAVFSPTGGGKGVSCIGPFLLTCPEPCVVLDPKGENAKLFGEHRRKRFGHEIIYLDPFKLVTATPHTLNPLHAIDPKDPHAFDDCNDLAKALVVRQGDERDPHWNDSAEAWISALIATTARYGDEAQATRSLQALRDLLQPHCLPAALKVMGESDAYGGMLARAGAILGHYVDREKGSVLTSVSRHLRFLDTLAIAASTRQSNFDPQRLRQGKMTVFLIVPPEYMRTQMGLLRLWISTLLRAVIRGGLQETRKVHFILDESASLGHLDTIDDAIDKYRGYGVRMQFYYQSLGQLKRCFPDGQDQVLLSNCTQIFFGVNDNATADYVSARLGEETVIVSSGGTSHGTSAQSTQGSQASHSSGRSGNDSRNWGQQARRLLKPEEVMTLPPRAAITFTPGVRPIHTTLLRYYEERSLGRRRWVVGAVAAVTRLVAASAIFAITVLLAVGVTNAVIPQVAARPRPQQESGGHTNHFFSSELQR